MVDLPKAPLGLTYVAVALAATHLRAPESTPPSCSPPSHRWAPSQLPRLQSMHFSPACDGTATRTNGEIGLVLPSHAGEYLRSQILHGCDRVGRVVSRCAATLHCHYHHTPPPPNPLTVRTLEMPTPTARSGDYTITTTLSPRE